MSNCSPQRLQQHLPTVHGQTAVGAPGCSATLAALFLAFSRSFLALRFSASRAFRAASSSSSTRAGRATGQLVNALEREAKAISCMNKLHNGSKP